MKYEVITLEEKIVAGIEARTNNTSPNMGMVIGGLWKLKPSLYRYLSLLCILSHSS